MPILFLLLFANSYAVAKNYFIHVVGTLDNAEKNYQDYFQEADSFRKYCSLKSNQGNKCLSLINLGAPGAPRQIVVEDENAGGMKSVEAPNVPVTRQQVLDELIAALKASKPGDQVHFALKNHGYPTVLDPSCISISSSQSICSEEIQKIIKSHKKEGVKVHISADACFSGGFADLSSREVCTSVSAAKTKFGYATPGTNFNYAKLVGQNLHESKMIGPTFDGRSRLMGSQIILNHMCSPIREALSKKNIPFKSDTIFASRASFCNGDLLRKANWTDVEKIGLNMNAELQLYRRYKTAICETKKTENVKPFCSAIEYILKNPVEASEFFLQAQAIAAEFESKANEFVGQIATLKLAVKERKKNPNLRRKYANAAKNLEKWIGPDGELNLFRQDLLWEAIDPQIKSAEKKLTELYRGLSSLHIDETRQRDIIFRSSKLPNFLESVFEINTCLAQPDETPDADELMYLPQGFDKVLSKYFGRGEKSIFSKKDYEDAVACEKDFKF